MSADDRRAAPADESALLDFHYREYPPLAPTSGRPAPRDVPALLLGDDHRLGGVVPAVSAALGPSRTSWRVHYTAAGRRNLTLMWLNRVTGEPGWPSACVDEIRRLSPEDLLPIIPSGSNGTRLDLAVDYPSMLHCRSSILVEPGPTSGGGMRRYRWDRTTWRLAAVHGSSSGDPTEVKEDLLRAPFSAPGVGFEPVDRLLAASASASVVFDETSVSVLGIGVDLMAVVEIATAAEAPHLTTATFRRLRDRLDHRTLDVELIVTEDGRIEVATWGVA